MSGPTVLMVVCHSPVRQRPTGARPLIPQPHLAKLALIDRVLRQDLLADAPYPADVGRGQARPRRSPSAVTRRGAVDLLGPHGLLTNLSGLAHQGVRKPKSGCCARASTKS